jgi:molybdenum cofactor synthesis domain-containing protein
VTAPTEAPPLRSVEEAIEAILAAIPEPLPAEPVAPERALGRYVAAPAMARTDLPPWDNSAMDGYAVRALDTATASESSPVVLRVTGEVRAGETPAIAVEPGTALRIATGAPIPPGADAVVPVELTIPTDPAGWALGPAGRDATGPLPPGVRVVAAVPAGGSVRVRGGDLRAGDIVLASGSAMTPAAVALAAGAGIDEVIVHRRPRVAVLATGDEIRPPGAPLGPAGIPDANGPGLRALVAAAGADPLDLGIARDRLEDVASRLTGAIAQADVVIVSGGVSVGPYDVVRSAFERVGRVDLWRVAVQPGKPFAFGVAERPAGAAVGRRSVNGPAGVLLFGLPGNPVSTAVTFQLFVRPALRRLSGGATVGLADDRGVLAEPVSKSQGRRAYIRVVVDRDPGGRVRRDEQGRVIARLAGGQGSHVLSALAAADALAVVPEDVGGLDAGAEVEIHWLGRG